MVHYLKLLLMELIFVLLSPYKNNAYYRSQSRATDGPQTTDLFGSLVSSAKGSRNPAPEHRAPQHFFPHIDRNPNTNPDPNPILNLTLAQTLTLTLRKLSVRG